jgi:hypothetical protein
MPRVAIVLLAAAAAFAADDLWSAVRSIKSGAEIRVFKRGSAQPISANMDELRDDSLIVVVKNAQVAIPRDQVERIDARPPQTSSRVTRESKSATVTARDGKPTTSASSGVSFGSKPDFETVYRRTAGAAK